MSTLSSAEVEPTLSERVLVQIESMILESERDQKPLEVDPYRSRLFELFVTAEGAGYLADNSDPDLTADGICQTLAARWGLKSAAQASVRDQSRLSADHMARMRSLWSVMRMWMEWTYAWNRWAEFHSSPTN